MGLATDSIGNNVLPTSHIYNYLKYYLVGNEKYFFFSKNSDKNNLVRGRIHQSTSLFQGWVACMDLGWEFVEQTFTNSQFGPGIGKFSYDNLACIGSEGSVDACDHSNIANSTCNEDTVAGVICVDIDY